MHAKFPHIYVFWKGRMNIGTALCVGVLLTPIGFHASSQNINTFKNKFKKSLYQVGFVKECFWFMFLDLHY